MDIPLPQACNQNSLSSTITGVETPFDGESLNGRKEFGFSDPNTQDVSHELDGNEIDPIVVCGLSMRFPQEATSPEGLWKLMMERKCVMTEFPSERLSLRGFHNKRNRLNTIPVGGGHFLKDDLSVFDAAFFSLAPNEATSIDPMQRWLLEEAYRALENAGIPMEGISGSRTAVYVGSFGFDYMLQLCRDPENAPMYAALGFGISMLANRLSWFFNLQGPSIGLDSACSSTAMALDMACKSLNDGSCDMAMVGGCNIANSPESYLWMSNIGFLSPDSRCYSFDHRANGYARGEGVGVVLLKRLSDALRDGNTIRAVIRSTASNEDGRTPGITQPSRIAQERLIRETYQKAGLSMAHTRYFEAHGTGTAIGDPREAQAIGSVFRKYRSTADPIYVGALKSMMGHLEGASGLAALIKAILVLEKGIIPPNANFESLNPKIDAQFLKLKFPTQAYPWPTAGLRRASIQSFGYGGANCHIVLDDAYNYLRLRSLRGRHSTKHRPTNSLGADVISHIPLKCHDSQDEECPRLLVWSSSDQQGIARTTDMMRDWYKAGGSPESRLRGTLLDDLAHTLGSHRTQLQWRSFAMVKSLADFALHPQISSPVHVSPNALRLGFVFTGQGAQWFAMGRELIVYSSFDTEMSEAEIYLRSIGCSWSLREELLKTSRDTSSIDNPERSQTCCTVLQIALVNLMRIFKVMPSAVVGHSSGEIAAAYAGGYLSRESAWKLSYYRGVCSADLAEHSSSKGLGAMMSIALPPNEGRRLVMATNRNASTFGISIACYNSPRNITIAGETRLIDQLQAQLDGQEVFARKLRVPVAYHSRQMNSISAKYKTMIGSLSGPPPGGISVPMISTVTGERVLPSQLRAPSYWVQNMTSPVQFSQAVTVMCKHTSADIVKKIDRSHLFESAVNHILELGPHPALQGPLRDILNAIPRGSSVGYSSLLKRSHPAVETMLNTLGMLYSIGYPVALGAVNTPSNVLDRKVLPSLLVDLPGYPFDHSQRYWQESRLSRNYRLRSHAPSQLIGVRTNDWNASEARWRHTIRAAEIPWAEQHVINGTKLYPGAGMLVMAIEAAKQLVGETHSVAGYTLRDVYMENPMDLGSGEGALEVETHLHLVESSTQGEKRFDFAIRTWSNDWIRNCRGSISVQLLVKDRWVETKIAEQRQMMVKDVAVLKSHCERRVDAQHMYRFLRQHGYDYGPVYQAAQQQRYNDKAKQATAEVTTFRLTEEDHVVHPVTLDAILHLAFTAKTSGGSIPMATCIPSRIGCLWVSDKGLSWPEQSSVTACCSVQDITRRGFTCAGTVVSNNVTGELCLWYDSFELVNITSDSASIAHLPNPKQFCMNIEHKVALKYLTSAEACAFVRKSRPVTQDLSSFFRDVRQLVELTLERFINTVDPTMIHSQDPWRRQYLNWAKCHLAQRPSTFQQDDSHLSARNKDVVFQELCERLPSVSRMGRLYVEVASNLIAIFNGEANPLELLLKSGLLKDGYADWAAYDCAKHAAHYVDLLAHQSPGMNILEVGGGTATTTRNLIGALRSGLDGSARSLRCNRYDFTDISSAFLEQAREEFAIYHSQMSFSTLDVETNFTEQGFSEGFYDLVAADNVLHVTPDLSQTLRNVRKALRPGGKLIMHELLQPTGWTAGFIFGLFPGWWLGVDDGRALSPNLTPDQWDVLLKANGFSGVDMVFRDFDDDATHQVGWLVATAIETPSVSSLAISQVQPPPIIIIDKSSESQHFLSSALVSPLHRVTGSEPRIFDLAAAALLGEVEMDALIVLLVDYGSSFLGSLNETNWNHMSSLIQKTRRLLWVSAGGGREANPKHGMIDGLARTLRSEYYDLHLVTVALDLTEGNSSTIVHLESIAQEMLSRSGQQPYEQDYTEIDGLLHTRRLVEATNIKSEIDARVTPYKVSSTPLDGKVRFRLPTSSPLGAEDAPHYVQVSEPSKTVMNGDTVDILVRAVAVQTRSCSDIVEQRASEAYGRYCSGVVMSTGSHSAFAPGDRVLAAHTGSFRSHVQAPSKFIVKIPADLSFIDACSTIPPRVSAYHAIVEIGDLKQGQSILVHDGVSPIGEAAIRLLAEKGIEDVWTTATTEEENTWITEHHRFPADRILPKSWFDSHSGLVSRWKRRFDAVLTQATNAASLSLDCIKVGGRSLSISSPTMEAKDGQLIRSTLASVCEILVFVDTATPESLAYAISDSSSRFSVARKKAVVSRAPDLTNIFTNLRELNGFTTFVTTFAEEDCVDVRDYGQLQHEVDHEATYLIAGGFGGLGRAVARWLVGRGARYLILLSRSGPSTVEAQELIGELANQGVRVEAPCCDISDSALLRTVLRNCTQNMPSIKGCIQSSMVMTELIFQKLRFQDWQSTVDPKVKGSWNLHAELPKGLDFFIMFSSVMGIIGTGSLAAYNAGNTYEDALASYRVSQGERAVSIDLGAIPDAGYFVDRADELRDVQLVEKHALTYMKEVCALLDIFCNPRDPPAKELIGSQVIVGLRPPAHWKHLEEVPSTMSQPFWGHMHHVAPYNGLEQSIDGKAVRDEQIYPADRLSAAGSITEATEIVRLALTRRVSVLLGTPEDRLDGQKPMHSFGIDSLSSIDIRNWVGKVFGIDLPIFDILGGATFESASRYIAHEAQLK